jgi:hypothetical protein
MNRPSRARGKLILHPIVGNGDALDQLHNEVGQAGLRRAGVKHLGDVRVFHKGQRLSLRLKAGNDLPRVHAWLGDFQRHLAADRLLLLSDEDETHTALADLFHQPVRADDRTRPFTDGLFVRGGNVLPRRTGQKAVFVFVKLQQPLDALPKSSVTRAGLLEVSGTGIGVVSFQGGDEYGTLVHGRSPHRVIVITYTCAKPNRIAPEKTK